MEARNLLGGRLQPCSHPHGARTGFFRDGTCRHGAEDVGSHHVCLKRVDEAFCQGTGQSNWCTSELTCHDSNAGRCPIREWCVCEWAFARFVREHGCDAIGEVDCSATNALVVQHYTALESPAIEETSEALRCLRSKCGLEGVPEGIALTRSDQYTSNANPANGSMVYKGAQLTR